MGALGGVTQAGMRVVVVIPLLWRNGFFGGISGTTLHDDLEPLFPSSQAVKGWSMCVARVAGVAGVHVWTMAEGRV